jgi:hypothetical protein
MSEEKKKEIPQHIRDLAAALKKQMTVLDSGVFELPADAYETHLPDGLTAAHLKKGQAFTTDLLAAQALATGELGIKFFNKHPTATQVSSELKIGKDSITSVFQRSKPVPDGKGGIQTKHGVSSTKYSAYAAGSSRGSLKLVRDLLSAQAEAAAKG